MNEREIVDKFTDWLVKQDMSENDKQFVFNTFMDWVTDKTRERKEIDLNDSTSWCGTCKELARQGRYDEIKKTNDLVKKLGFGSQEKDE